MNQFDLEEATDFVQEHGTSLAIAACVVVGLASVVLGGGSDVWVRQQATKADDRDSALSQKRAERIFFEQGCSTQVLNQTTRTANLVDGAIVIDPASMTPDNPNGTIFNGAHACSTDGSIFLIKEGVAFLVGTSPKIRNAVVAQGAAKGAKDMEAYAKLIYQQAQQR